MEYDRVRAIASLNKQLLKTNADLIRAIRSRVTPELIKDLRERVAALKGEIWEVEQSKAIN